jgi:hypothetical protein
MKKNGKLGLKTRAVATSAAADVGRPDLPALPDLAWPVFGKTRRQRRGRPLVADGLFNC